MKSLMATIISTCLLPISVATAQTKSISFDQKISFSEVPLGAPIKYQANSHGKQGRRVPGVYYDHCLSDAKNYGKKYLTALVPTNSLLTTALSPKLFFYIPRTPKTSVKALEFVLLDANQQLVYKQTFKVNNESGVFKLPLPMDSNKSMLQVGQEYRWFFSAICDSTHRSRDLVTTGWLQRITPNEKLTMELNKAASLRERAAIYAASGIWQDSLDTLAELRFMLPNDAVLVRDWKNLLDSVNLGEISQEPLVGELEAE